MQIDKVMPHQISQVNENGYITFENTIKLAIYNEGSFEIPGLNILADSNISVVSAQKQVINVLLPPAVMESDSLSINPIKDIIVEPKTWQDYLYLLYILLSVSITYWLWRKWKSKKSETPTLIPAPEVYVPSPSEIAINRLNSLRDSKIWLQGREKDFQSDLTDTIRNYLAGQFGIKAMEMTTLDIEKSTSKLNLNHDDKNDLSEILNIADLVKFAKAKPEIDIHEEFLNQAYSFVNHTSKV
jgi:hypothetical protein